MPSKNKKNKNRAQTQPTTSGTSASKNGSTPVKISEDSEPSNEPEPKSDLKSTISVAKEKLEQLQQTVDTIKASISQSKVEEKSDTKPSDVGPDEKAEQPFEMQTMKKKRNRNRNRNRNKHSQNNTTDESGMSSTSGTNENSTHENSPTPATLTTIELPTSNVITSKITEEPSQIDSNESMAEIKRNEHAENVVKVIETETAAEIQTSPKIEEIESKPEEIESNVEEIKPKPIESESKIEEVPTKTVEYSMVEDEKVPLVETTIENKDNEEASKEDGKMNEKTGTKEKDKRTKDNDKQRKNRQGKNGNKNEKEMSNAEPKNQDGNKIDSTDHLEKMDRIDTIQTMEDAPDMKKVNPEPKNKNNKTAKENKKSLKMNKNSQESSGNDPIEIEKKQLAEPNKDDDSTLTAEKNIDGDESGLIKKVDEPKETSTESVEPSSKATEEPNQAAQQSQSIEEIPLPSDQTENISQELKIEKKSEFYGATSKKDVVAKEEPKLEPEIEEKPAEKIKPETKQQSSENRKAQAPFASASAKESKKSKGKKSPPQTKTQNEPKENNDKEIKIDPVAQKIEEKPRDKPAEIAVETAATEQTNEDKSPKESSGQTEVHHDKVKAATDEKLAKKSEEVSQIESSKPTTNCEATKVEIVPKEPTASTSKIQQPKTDVETKQSEPIVATTSDEVTKTPSTTPVLTYATATSKKSTQQEDETAKIWKILEEASKSLEPVEIEMEDPMMSSTNPPSTEITTSNMCATKNDEQLKEETQELVTVLETKEPVKQAKQGAQPKAPKPKENIQQTSSPTKTTDPQSKKSADPKKKDSKPAQKNTKPNKAAQPQSNSTPEKMPEKTPPLEVANEPVALPTEEIPLDVSIMPSEIEVAELNADSKNVQGSDFVPFVEQSTGATESLVPDDDINVEAVQSIQVRDSKSKSKSPINVKKEKTPDSNHAKAQPSASKNVQECKVAEPKVRDKKESTASPPTESKKSQSKSVSPEKSKQSAQNSKQKEVNAKNAQGKPVQNNKKANGKPLVPPKPEHLVSSQAKKTPGATTTKSESAVKSKTEKILVLTGNIEDDDSEDDYIEYKFMPRQVFISTICQACKKPTTSTERILCQLCQMVSYCCIEHGQNDEPIHKDLCGALQEIAKKRGGHIYNNARILNNNDYRSLRVHTLNLCENFLKRPLQTYEREILLFPRLCSTQTCREWRQNLLTDCPGCGQVFFCTAQPDHLDETHQRWCKSVALYQKLVVTQSVSGRIEPSLPSRIQTKPYTLPNNIADVFKDLYKNYSAIKDDCVFATLTQLATAPLTAYFATQKADQQIGEKFTIHLIGAELQFEADVLDIWETFFLHLAHNLMELTIVFCGPELNAENIPLDIISRIRMCRTCRQNCRIVKFDFQCAKFYHDYAKSSAYSKPDLICFFNPGFHHINSLNGMDTWSETIKIASSSGCPVVVTSYTEYESPRDLDRFQSESSNADKQMTLIHGPEFNAYSSQRPERNFISDEIVPLIFKNYFCFIMK